MASDTPWQILNQNRLNIPGLLQQAGEAKTRRLQEMMLNRQVEREDREADREDKLLGIYAKLKQPGSQPKGGGPASGGVGGGEAPPRPSNIQSGSPMAPQAGQMGAMGSPEAPAQQAPPEVVQSWVEANRDVVGQLLTIDPGKAFALTEQLSKLDDVGKARVKEMNELRGRVALTLANVPQAQRGQALASLMPRLREMGITPDIVRQELGDLSDMSLQMAASLSQDVATLSKAQEEYTLQPGAARYRGDKMISERPFAPKTLTVGEGDTVVEYQPGGSGGGTGGAVNPAQFDEIAASVVPGIVKTSGMRSPEKNAAVGGVANSYHLTGEASDYVPPKGMTMDALAQTLRQAMPGAQVINEGDHVHVEPASRQQGGSRVIAQGGPKQEKAPAGYRWTPQGTLAPITGGPADPEGVKGSAAVRKEAVGLRKDFNNLPEVKDFKDVRANYQQVRALGLKKNATAQDDISLIFSFMKMLDPGSVVREGEFAVAARAAGVPDRIVNAIGRAESGKMLNTTQRAAMVQSAREVYVQRATTYNQTMKQYRDYAKDFGVDPDMVAKPLPRVEKATTKVGGAGWSIKRKD